LPGLCPIFLSIDFHSQADSLQEVAGWPPLVLSVHSTLCFSERKLPLTNCFVQIPRIISLSIYLGLKLISKSIAQTWVMWLEQGLGRTCPIAWMENKGEVPQRKQYVTGERRTHPRQQK